MAKRNEFDAWVIDNMKRHGSLLVSPKSAFLAGMRAGRRAERRKVAELKAEIRDIYNDLFPKVDLSKIFRKLS